MDPYTKGMFTENPYASKTEVCGELVVVLRGQYPERGLKLMQPRSRALNLGEVHELIVTDQDASPGSTVNPIAYLGFFVTTRPGMVLVGDQVTVGNLNLGQVSGFDETHMPNHLNIVLAGERVSGEEQGLVLGTRVVFSSSEY